MKGWLMLVGLTLVLAIAAGCASAASTLTSTQSPTLTPTPVLMTGPDNLRMSGLYGRLGFTLNW